MADVVKWIASPDLDNRHTAMTKYETDGFVLWKGKYQVFSCLYSANKWHLERLSDRKILFSAKTAKECKATFDNSVKRGIDVHTEEWLNSWVNLSW